MNKEICILNGTKWILGDESTEPMNWEDANNWCKSIGQDLPPREVLLMAFLNPEIRSKFANDYYWSSSEFDSNFAWLQDFTNGYQKYYWSKLNTLSVQAVWAIGAEASEHTEQEPVAWITEWVQRYRHNDTPIMDRAVSFTKGDAPAVPNPNYIPLYTAPPKREPVEECTNSDTWNCKYCNKTNSCKALKDSRNFAPPKREPLSTDTMLRLITEHRDFPLNLVRAVEKEHGIGGGNEF